jgi:hypothetical protein
MSGKIIVEFVGGPLDGRRDRIPIEGDPRFSIEPNALLDEYWAKFVHEPRDLVHLPSGVYLRSRSTNDYKATRYRWHPVARDAANSAAHDEEEGSPRT